MGKKTTTLTLDEEVVAKAKKMGINISELTETVLKGFTFEPKSANWEAMINKYEELFQVILPILDKNGISIEIGNVTEYAKSADENVKFLQPIRTLDVRLLPDGTFRIDEVDVIFKSLRDIKDIGVSSPKSILRNLIEEIEKSKDKYKEDIKEIELVKRLVHAISPTLIENIQPVEIKKKGGGVSRQKKIKKG